MSSIKDGEIPVKAMSVSENRPLESHHEDETEGTDTVNEDTRFGVIQNATGRDRSGTTNSQRPRRPSAARRPSQGVVGRMRGLSISQILDANPAPGMWAATGAAIAQAPNLTQLQDPHLAENISFNAQGHSVHKITVPETEEPEPEFTGLGRVATIPLNTANATLISEDLREHREALNQNKTDGAAVSVTGEPKPPRKKHHWGKTIAVGLKAFWKFFLTPSGFLITIYGLNVVGWGAMLFFLLLKAAPAMNHPSADDDNSPRKIWLEIDSQILNALFCVTGFGLAPWRFMDLYLLLSWRFKRNLKNHIKLASKNISWYRMSEDLTEPKLTSTGRHAPPTKWWVIDAVVWLMVMNTFLQAVLCFFMWHYNRIERPSWSTGLFIGLGCGTAMVAGIFTWWEGRKVKIIEGPAIEIQEKEEAMSESELEAESRELDEVKSANNV